MDSYRNHPNYMRMNVDSLFKNGIQILKKNYAWLFFYSFIMMVLIQLLTAPLLGSYFENLPNLVNDPTNLGPMMGNMFVLLIITLVGYTLLSAFLTNYVFNFDLEKNHLKILGESILKFFIPLLVASVIAGLIATIGVLLGVFALIIGSLVAMIYFSAIFFPLTAIIVNEKVNPLESIPRCFRLVHSDLWNTIGWVVLILVIYFIVSLILGTLTMIPSAGSFFEIMSNPEEVLESANGLAETISNPINLLLNSLTSALLFPVFPVFGMLIYFHLKHIEDEKTDHSDLMDQLK